MLSCWHLRLYSLTTMVRYSHTFDKGQVEVVVDLHLMQRLHHVSHQEPSPRAELHDSELLRNGL